MARYLLSVHTRDDQPQEPMTPEQMKPMMKAIGALEAEMRSAGALFLSGRLTGPREARVVRKTNGKVIRTDGPFVETKEQIGGFYIVDANDLDAALDWAAKTSAAVGQPIEVRPFADHAGA